MDTVTQSLAFPAASAAQGDLPRERMMRFGASVLTEPELLALVLQTGCRGSSALALAHQILEESGGLAGLVDGALNGPGRPGLGPVKRAAVAAAIEVGRRLARAKVPRRYSMDRPEAVASYLSLEFTLAGQEVMGAVCVDSRNRLLCAREVFRGTLNRAAVEPRALLKLALARDAAGLILFHTHPSGDPTPSVEDLEFTRRIDAAGEVVGIRLIDHLILGNGGNWLSLRRRGGW